MADKVDVATVLTAVGALMDIGEPDDTTTPTQNQIRQWAYDASSYMARVLPPEKCGGLLIVNETYDNSALDYPAVRIIDIQRSGHPCDILSSREYYRIKALDEDIINETPIASYSFQGDGDVTVLITPTSQSTSVTYICMPGPFNGSGVWTDVDRVPPKSWTDLIIEYCVMKAKYQDEEPEQSQLAKANWIEAVGAFANADRSGVQ